MNAAIPHLIHDETSDQYPRIVLLRLPDNRVLVHGFYELSDDELSYGLVWRATAALGCSRIDDQALVGCTAVVSDTEKRTKKIQLIYDLKTNRFKEKP